MRELQKIKVAFDARVRSATSEAEVDAAVDDAIKAVARHASAAQIAAALLNAALSTADRRAISKAFGIGMGEA
jgi:hypothetical protein